MSPCRQPVSGCAFSAQTRPCVAQRVCPMPVVARDVALRRGVLQVAEVADGADRRRASRSRRAPDRRSHSRGTRAARGPAGGSALRLRVPTYPMIPHMSELSPSRSGISCEKHDEPGLLPHPARCGQPSSSATSAAMLAQRARRFLLRRGLREHAHDGLRARRPDEHPAGAAETRVHALDLRAERVRELLRRRRARSLSPADSAPARRPLRRASGRRARDRAAAPAASPSPVTCPSR